MTDTPEDNAAEIEDFKPLPLDQLPQFPYNGMPCYVALDPSVLTHVEANGEMIYFALCATPVKIATGEKTTKVVKLPVVFKVVNNAACRAMLPQITDIPLAEAHNQADVKLPKIPWDLMKTVEIFFRQIADMYGTESIIVLTWNATEEAWGVIVPKQENTAANCDYKPETLADLKSDDEVIVGSIHSHPGMPAYASGTDHKDQAEFDGIHITIGWQQKNQNRTEYYAELQVMGESFKLNPEDIIAEPNHEVPETQLEEWASQVEKKTYQSTGTWSGHAGRTSSSSGPANLGYKGHESAHHRSASVPGARNIRPRKLPDGGPADLKDSIVIATLPSAQAKNCPFCDATIVQRELNLRRCFQCEGVLAQPGDKLSDVIEAHRRTLPLKAEALEQDSRKIYLWYVEGGENKFMLWRDSAKAALPSGSTDQVTGEEWFTPGK